MIIVQCCNQLKAHAQLETGDPSTAWASVATEHITSESLTIIKFRLSEQWHLVHACWAHNSIQSCTLRTLALRLTIKTKLRHRTHCIRRWRHMPSFKRIKSQWQRSLDYWDSGATYQVRHFCACLHYLFVLASQSAISNIFQILLLLLLLLLIVTQLPLQRVK
jgi:hypothetical protein